MIDHKRKNFFVTGEKWITRHRARKVIYTILQVSFILHGVSLPSVIYLLVSQSGQFRARVSEQVVPTEQRNFIPKCHVVEDGRLGVESRVDVHKPLVHQMRGPDHFGDLGQRSLTGMRISAGVFTRLEERARKFILQFGRCMHSLPRAKLDFTSPMQNPGRLVLFHFVDIDVPGSFRD